MRKGLVVLAILLAVFCWHVRGECQRLESLQAREKSLVEENEALWVQLAAEQELISAKDAEIFAVQEEKKDVMGVYEVWHARVAQLESYLQH